jgi:hypothetical protein
MHVIYAASDNTFSITCYSTSFDHVPSRLFLAVCDGGRTTNGYSFDPALPDAAATKHLIEYHQWDERFQVSIPISEGVFSLLLLISLPSSHHEDTLTIYSRLPLLTLLARSVNNVISKPAHVQKARQRDRR